MSLYAYKVALSKRTKLLFGARFSRSLRESWTLRYDEAAHHQAVQFASLYDSARQLVPFYAERPSLYPPREGRPLDALLTSLPVLTKQDLRAENLNLWQSPLPPLTSFHTTSGTTGTAVTLAATPFERGFLNLLIQQWIRRVTGKLFPRTLSLTGFFTPKRPALVHRAAALRSLYLSIYQLSPRNRSAVIEEIRRFKPELVWGYPSAIVALARLTEGAVQIPWSITTSEALLPEWRQDIENLLSSRTFDFYSSQEGAHAAFQCEHGEMHVHPSAGIVEILDVDGKPCNVGKPGRVVVTGLVRKSMPLIRYDLGDIASWKPKSCECGAFPYVLASLHGRLEDQIRTRDGGTVGLLGYQIFRSSRDIHEGQLVQHAMGEFEVKLVLRQHTELAVSQIEGRITTILKERLRDPSIAVRFTYPEAIERSSNGKFRAVRVLLQKSA